MSWDAMIAAETRRPCGCEGSCVCDPDSLTERGTFLRTCRGCELEFEGERMQAVDEWWDHVKSAEHKATWAARSAEIRVQVEDEEREQAGMLW